MSEKRKLIIALTGASGAALGVRLLEILKTMDEVEVHLIMSSSAEIVLKDEMNRDKKDVEKLADVVYAHKNIGAPPASGSFDHDGMIIMPCSIKTLSAIAHSYSSDLISRSADVCLKEGRLLLCGLRETPLHSGHLENMLKVSQLGGIIYPPVPAFYAGEQSFDEYLTQTAGRVLSRMGFKNTHYRVWAGLGGRSTD
ncbi:MAG: UbiX family flavin prenyltransferase [Planctomycetes bacterium]|nr:UbiX family flavin prenyltransferase [Planctomycetota bacterium]